MSGDRQASLIGMDLPGSNLLPTLGPGGMEPGDQLQLIAKYRTFFDEGAAQAPAPTGSVSYIPTWRRRRR